MSWDDVLSVGLGQMGIDPAVFWRLSLKEWYEKQRGYFLMEEQKQRAEWERIRWQTWVLALPNYKKGTINRPHDLLPFPWDEVVKAEPLSDEELIHFVHKFGKFFDGEGDKVNFKN